MKARIVALTLALVALSLGCSRAPQASARRGHRVLVLGFDGVDPALLDRFMAAGELPAFARLAREGRYQRLGTTVPPQSPVAWATFTTGLDPGGHGVFDFIHRDPAPPGGGAIRPFLSTSRVEEEEWKLPLGRFALPLRSGKTELLRRGKAFWNVLEEHGVPATILKIPANFPPEPTGARTISDMGTPDLRGTPRTFFFFTADPKDGPARSVSGGVIRTVAVADDHVRASLPGPPNPFLARAAYAERAFDVWVDRRSQAAKLEIDGQAIVLGKGEWSGWVPVRFDLVPHLASVGGIVRFHLASVEPLRLYASPVNIDPADPALPISTPPEYSRDLFEHVGYYYTQGFAEDTNALTAGMLSDDEFLEQARDVYAERRRLFATELARFREGLLFAYFGGVDQVSHVFWRRLARGAGGTAASPDAESSAILDAYRELDGALAEALGSIGGDPDVTLIVLSDHGFAPFARAANLNGWLRDQSLLALRPGAKTGRELFADVDWARTRAYGFGLNGLYVNLAGRERFGAVPPRERDAVIADLTARLLAWTDTASGGRVVGRVYRREEIYHGAERDLAPDLIVGYNRGYRVSNASALGETPAEVLEDNRNKWSGDHCIAADQVPGVLLANREIARADVSLLDVAPTVLAEFGVAPPADMSGRPFLAR
jgi:predicted AlkP superfamily phosphohydrolase/phosphomutase